MVQLMATVRWRGQKLDAMNFEVVKKIWEMEVVVANKDQIKDFMQILTDTNTLVTEWNSTSNIMAEFNTVFLWIQKRKTLWL